MSDKPKIVKCKCCGKEFEKHGRALFCSEACREEKRRLREVQQAERQREKRAAEKEAKKKAEAERKAFRTTDHQTLENRIKTAKEECTTYGKLQAEQYKKLVKVEFPKKPVSREFRAQQFNEIVEQNLLSNL